MLWRQFLTLEIFFGCVVLLAGQAFGIVTQSENENDTPPPNGAIPGFYDVGLLNNGFHTYSSVYLGNRWMITARHVGVFGPEITEPRVTFNFGESNAFTVDVERNEAGVNDNGSGNLVPLTIPNLDSSYPDFELFRLVPDSHLSSLPTVDISTVSVAAGNHVYMAGVGLVRNGAPAGGFYNTAAAEKIHWGENITSGTATIHNPDDSTSSYIGFTTGFKGAGSLPPPLANEAQVLPGDSGGAAFVGGQLAGLITLGSPPGINGTSAVVGQTSGFVDLATYRQAIIDTLNAAEPRLGDITGDHKINVSDIDQLLDDIRFSTTNVTTEDLNGDSTVDYRDVNKLVGRLVDISDGGVLGQHGTHFGDVNLSGTVDTGDLQLLTSNFNTSFSGSSYWEHGNFSGTGTVNVGDLETVYSNFDLSGPDLTLTIVPEPTSVFLLGFGGLIGVIALRGRSIAYFWTAAVVVFLPNAVTAATLTLSPIYVGSFSDDGMGDLSDLGMIGSTSHTAGEILEIDVRMTISGLLSNENFTGVTFSVVTSSNLVAVDPWATGKLWYNPATARSATGTGTGDHSIGPYTYRTFPSGGVASGSAGQPLKSYANYRGDTTTTTATQLFNVNDSLSGNSDLNLISVSVGPASSAEGVAAFNRRFGESFGENLGEPDQLRTASEPGTLIGSFFVQYTADDEEGHLSPGSVQIVPGIANDTTWTTLQDNTSGGGGTLQRYAGSFETFSSDFVAVPEPTPLVLMALGSAAVAFASRHRTKKNYY